VVALSLLFIPCGHWYSPVGFFFFALFFFFFALFLLCGYSVVGSSSSGLVSGSHFRITPAITRYPPRTVVVTLRTVPSDAHYLGSSHYD